MAISVDILTREKGVFLGSHPETKNSRQLMIAGRRRSIHPRPLITCPMQKDRSVRKKIYTPPTKKDSSDCIYTHTHMHITRSKRDSQLGWVRGGQEEIVGRGWREKKEKEIL